MLMFSLTDNFLVSQLGQPYMMIHNPTQRHSNMMQYVLIELADRSYGIPGLEERTEVDI